MLVGKQAGNRTLGMEFIRARVIEALQQQPVHHNRHIATAHQHADGQPVEQVLHILGNFETVVACRLIGQRPVRFGGLDSGFSRAVLADRRMGRHGLGEQTADFVKGLLFAIRQARTGKSGGRCGFGRCGFSWCSFGKCGFGRCGLLRCRVHQSLTGAEAAIAGKLAVAIIDRRTRQLRLQNTVRRMPFHSEIAEGFMIVKRLGQSAAGFADRRIVE